MVRRNRFLALKRQNSPHAPFNSRSGRCRARPRVERLEDRQLLAAVLFDPNAIGDSTKSVEEWGVDTAWPSDFNVRQSVENIGVANVDVVRVNFYLEHALNPDGTLSQQSRDLIDVQLGLADYAPGKPIALTPSIGNTDPSYYNGGVNIGNWIALMKASIDYVTQQSGRTVSAIEPFNEPDFWPGQGTPEELNTLMQAMVDDPDGAFDNMLIQGASTLASENAYFWYDRIRGPATSGTTHLLGSGPDALPSYAGFFPYVKSNGTDHSPDDVPYNPEIHSLAEMIVGADRGMEGGIFWGIVERPRALLVTTSDGDRLGYAEDLVNQNAAAVYRGLDGEIRGFAGGIERAGSPTQYELTSTGDPVYFNGIGPIDSYAALAKSDQQTAIEIDTTAAEAQPPLDGYRWKIINRASGGVLDLFGANPNDGGNVQLWEDNGGLNQLWDIRQQHNTYNGFFRVDDYLYISNASSGRLAEVTNFSLDDGANVQQFGLEPELVNRHWYIEPTGDGYFYIRNANSNKYLAAESNSMFANVVQDSPDGSALQQWEFVLTNPVAASGLQFAQDAAGTFPGATTVGGPNYGDGPGDAGMAIELDGADDYVQLSSTVANSDDMTVSTWVKWNGGNAWQRIFDFGNSTDEYMMLTPSSGGGKMRFAITTGGYTQELGLETLPLAVGQWHHVAVTLGGNTGILYVDGVPVTAGQIPTNATDFNPTLNYVGKSQFPDPLFSGSLSEFAVYDFALSAEQIAAIAGEGLDFGDAPTAALAGGGPFVVDYPVIAVNDGARHLPTGPHLGLNRDGELDGTPSGNADADDLTGVVDDEDGVTNFGPIAVSIISASSASVDVNLQSPSATNLLDAWIDWNRDGDWNDSGEQIFASHDLGTVAGVQTLSFPVPQDTGANVEDGVTYARFRLSTSGGLSPTGLAQDGEVEDYQVTIVVNDLVAVENLWVSDRTPTSITIAWDDLSSLFPPTQSVLNFFDTNYPNWGDIFGNNSTTDISLVSGPVADQMNNGPQGQQWLAQGEGYDFKLTIENGTGISIESLVTELERLPEPYVRAFEEVSDLVGENGVSPEDGVAVYADLAGAAGHGSQFYLNLHTDVINFGWAGVTAHEAGHVLQQVADEINPSANYLQLWEDASVADGRSISPYGDTSFAEELAEFALFYAVALDLESGSSSTALDELHALAPERFALWEEILQYDSGTIPSGFRVETSTDDGASWTHLGDAAPNATTFTESGLTPVTEHYYRVRPFNNSSWGYWRQAIGATPATSLPASWASQDIGVVAGPGAAESSEAGSWTTISGGTDIWNDADSFHFTYKALVGDGEIVARVDSIEDSGAFAKAGVMIRESLVAGARQATVNLTPTNGVQFIRRLSTGGVSDGTTTHDGTVAPQWVRLTRVGDSITAYFGADGVNWTQLGSETIAMDSVVYVGLASASWNSAQLNTSSFSNVDVVGQTDLDFGDAPISYGTLIADGGAAHVPAGPRLGDSRDGESGGQPSVDADGDDTGSDDEDGVMFGVVYAGNTIAAVNIDLQNASDARIDAWIDFDGNGNWDPSDQILDSAPVSAGLQTLNFAVPVAAQVGETFARVRVSTAGDLNSGGIAADGEVEDYKLDILDAVPSVVEVAINNHDSQRSSTTELKVTFDREVTAPDTAFSIKNRDTEQTVDSLIVNSSVVDGRTVAHLTFGPGSQVIGGNLNSLIDANYRLEIIGSQITGLGNSTSMPSDFEFGELPEDNFFRKYGDHNGNGVVDLLDFAEFRQTFGKSAADNGYQAELDSDGDDTISLLDFAKFRQNFG